MAHKPNSAQVTAGAVDGLGAAKPTWVVDVFARESDFDPWEDHSLIDADGFVHHTIELADAPNYVVPITFKASCDDSGYPTEVTLEIEVRRSAGAFIRSITLDPRRAKTLPGSAWPMQGMAEYEHVGAQPALPVPRLLREALAYAAMPRERQHVDEMGYHAEHVMGLLQSKRAPRISAYERDLMRHFYAETMKDPRCKTKQDRLHAVYEKLNQVLPDEWPWTGSGARRTADYSRLRPFFDEMEAELERIGSRTLEPGSFKLPDGWTD